MNSIIQSDKICWLCGRSSGALERHYCFGASNRDKSEKYGLVVYLCHDCHNEPPNGVHFRRGNNLALKQEAQQRAMDYYGWTVSDFIELFGRSYL